MALITNLYSALAQGTLWGIMALGVYITFRILDIADLSCDGTFALGGCISAILITRGVNPFVTLLFALVGGMLAGLVTGWLHTKLMIPAILAGILTMIALWSVNIRVMGGPNVSLLGEDTAFTKVMDLLGVDQTLATLVVGVIIGAIVIAALYWFFGTEIGCALRATGNNEFMVRALGGNTDTSKVLGLVISNGLISVSGALVAQNQGYGDIKMGTGSIVIGLASIVIGEVIFGKRFNFAYILASLIGGAMVYRMIISLVLHFGLSTDDMKLHQHRKRGKVMLEIKNVHKTFNKGTINEKKALNGVNLHLDPGDFVTIIGGNGAGKSTTLNMVAGVYPIDQGTIILDGKDISDLPEYKRAYMLGRVFQDPMMGTAAGMQIEENMAMANRRGKKRGLSWGITKKEKEMFKEKLQMLDLGLEDRMTSKVGLLSGGQRQALTLLMATLKKPSLLLLDEHTAALDPKTAKKVLDITEKIVARDNLTTMMVTHNMKDAINIGNRLIMMSDGKIIYDVKGEEKKKLKVADLLQKFEEASGGEFANDRMLLSLIVVGQL